MYLTMSATSMTILLYSVEFVLIPFILFPIVFIWIEKKKTFLSLVWLPDIEPWKNPVILFLGAKSCPLEELELAAVRLL